MYPVDFMHRTAWKALMVLNDFRKHFKGCLLQRVVHYNLVTVKLGTFFFFLIIIIKSRVWLDETLGW